MILIEFIKTFWTKTKSVIGRLYATSKCRRANPSSFISDNASISNSSFGGFNAVFGDTIVMNCSIGNYSYIQTNGRIFNCTIGKFCSIGSGVTIAPGMHDLKHVTTSTALTQKSTPLPKVFAKQDNVEEARRVYIGHDVWIGERVVILDGVTVGNGAVIAAGAVVVKDVKPYEVVGGVPAKHIKYRFDQPTIEAIENSKWWDFPDEWFEENAELMIDPKQFVKKLQCLSQE